VSSISDAMEDALSTMATAKGETLGYRTGTSGAFTTLTGWVLHRESFPQAQFDERSGGERYEQTANLSGPLATPTMVVGYQVQDGNSAVWAVESVMADQHQVCLVRRIVSRQLGPDRGSAR
jgi:hypothetical protein